MGEHLGKAQGVEHAICRHAALAGNGDAPLHEVQFTDRVRIGVPAFGPAGAGWALVIPFALGSLIMVRYLRSSSSVVRLNFRGIAPRWELFADILKVGVLGLVNTAVTNLSIVILTGIAGQFGPEAAIGYARGARLEYIMQPIAFGFGTAIVAMVGTNWGAGQYHRARQIMDRRPHNCSPMRRDWTDRRRTTEPLVGPLQQRPRSGAHWRNISGLLDRLICSSGWVSACFSCVRVSVAASRR